MLHDVYVMLCLSFFSILISALLLPLLAGVGLLIILLPEHLQNR